MPNRHRSGSGALRGCRETSIPHDAYLVDAGRNLVGMHQPFLPAQPRQASISVCGVVFITYLVCASCLGVIGLVTILTTHHSIGDHILQRRLAEPNDLPSSRAPIETLADMLRIGRAPEQLLEYSDVAVCRNASEPAASDLEKLHPKIKFLMVIGTQKSGTTWLYEALTRHQSFIPAMRRPGEDADIVATTDPWRAKLLTKEPQYFNRWPLPSAESYLHAWHSGVVGAMVSGAAGERVLLDASPQYLMSSAAPPRVKATVPHARFVLVVRDPPMRALSDFVMMRRQHPLCLANGNPSRICPPTNTTFLATVTQELHDRTRAPECFFNSTASDHTTWHSCFSCAFNYIDLASEDVRAACGAHEASLKAGSCSEAHYGLIDHGLYAAQLAWWLRFFPPEQFLVVSTGQLRDASQRLQVLNRIREHAGLSAAADFTQQLINGTEGFGGNYNVSEFSTDDHEALRLLRTFYSKDQQDLHRLVDMLYPDANFSVELES